MNDYQYVGMTHPDNQGYYEAARSPAACVLKLTYDDRPHVVPATDVWIETLRSFWGASASWDIDGAWDP